MTGGLPLPLPLLWTVTGEMTAVRRALALSLTHPDAAGETDGAGVGGGEAGGEAWGARGGVV